MTADSIHALRRAVREKRPLIHCITNPISINQCANAILAVGARPMMAEHPEETAEITATAQALLLNLGNITDVRMQSMMRSAEAAGERDIPVVIDAVGISCSTLRRNFLLRLLDTARPALIKGNYSEILALYDSAYRSCGVDADDALEEDSLCRAAVSLAGKYRAVILASGKIDIVTDGRRAISIKNGTPQLASVTGTGCMLGALCACFLSAKRDITAALTACALLGISGELAHTDGGLGSFAVKLMDMLSLLSDDALEENLSTEETKIESI